jgi:hypothetical protein
MKAATIPPTTIVTKGSEFTISPSTRGIAPDPAVIREFRSICAPEQPFGDGESVARSK